MLQNAVRGLDNGDCDGLPVLQSGAGSAGCTELLAPGDLFSCGDVLRAEEDRRLEQEVDRASDFQLRMLDG